MPVRHSEWINCRLIDAKLLEDVALDRGNLNNPVAREAFGTFYERHATWLYARLRRTRVFGLLKAMDAVQDVVQETFYRAFKGASTFNPDFATDPRRLEGLVRGWLGAIANRVIADMLNRPEPDALDADRLEPAESAWEVTTNDSVLDSPVVRALKDELQKLSPLQQDILAAAEFYYQPDSNYQRLPNGVTQRIAEKHRTSSANIRQVRRRTMADIRKKLLPLLEED